MYLRVSLDHLALYLYFHQVGLLVPIFRTLGRYSNLDISQDGDGNSEFPSQDVGRQLFRFPSTSHTDIHFSKSLQDH